MSSVAAAKRGVFRANHKDSFSISTVVPVVVQFVPASKCSLELADDSPLVFGLMRLVLLFLLAFTAAAFADALNGHCDKQMLPAAVHPKPGRKYARDRLVDLLHLKLDVLPDFAQRTITATVEWSFKPIARPLPKITFDAVGLHIDDLKAEGAQVAGFQSTDEELIIDFAQPVVADSLVKLTIRYHVQPENGIYFRTPEMGYKKGDTQVWTQGEAELHRYWFPCYDYPNERYTSEVICHVPDGMEVVSNGHLVSKTKDAQGLNEVHWLQDKPHVTYLVALAAGYFHKIDDKVGDLPLAVLVPPSEKEQAANAFLDTKKIITFYQKEIGVPFAWDKYYQVYCHDFLAGGMENTSCTFQAADLLYRSNTEQINSLHWLDAHETAHQWFGDLVTSRDWSNLWLNEGFASYYTILYENEKNGRDAMVYALYKEAEHVLSQADTKPVVWRDYADAMDQFDYRVYPKGAWVLHMMRSRLGPDLYRKCIKAYVEKHRNTVVGTDDLQNVLDDLTGLSWDQFFDQWLYHGGQPDVQVDYAWDGATKLAKLSIRQTQKLSDQVQLFRFDLPVRFTIAGKAEERTITVSKAAEDFYFSLPAAPEMVRLDPDYALLAKWHFNPPGEMLKKQLTSDVMGRILAVQNLGTKEDHDSIGLLKQTLNGDAFYGVRIEAARALKKIGSAESRSVLVESLVQPDARVRKEVVAALSAYPHPDAQQALWALSKTEKNPEILAAIIETWGARPGDKEVAAALRDQLKSNSYREVLAKTAIQALRAQDDATAVPAIMARLIQTPEAFTGRDFGRAMESLAFLARNDKDRSAVRSFIAARLNDPRKSVATAAAKSLGVLRDPAAIAVLEPLTKVMKPFNDPLPEAAEQALQKLHSTQDTPVDLTNLWQQLQALQKKSEKMEKELADAKAKEKEKATAKPAPVPAKTR